MSCTLTSCVVVAQWVSASRHLVLGIRKPLGSAAQRETCAAQETRVSTLQAARPQESAQPPPLRRRQNKPLNAPRFQPHQEAKPDPSPQPQAAAMWLPWQ